MEVERLSFGTTIFHGGYRHFPAAHLYQIHPATQFLSGPDDEAPVDSQPPLGEVDPHLLVLTQTMSNQHRLRSSTASTHNLHPRKHANRIAFESPQSLDAGLEVTRSTPHTTILQSFLLTTSAK